RHRPRGGASRRDLAPAGVLPAWRRGSRRRRRPGCGPQVVRGLDRRRTGRAARSRREGRRRPAREPRVSGRPRVLTPVAALRLGLAGAGRMGRNHLRAIAGSALVKVTAIAEPVASTRTLLEGTDAAVYGELDDMLDSAPIDAVLVCVPSDLHLTTIRRLVEARMPILCEKPVGVTASEARAAAGLVKAAGLPFQVGFWRRFVPSLTRLKVRITGGGLV